MRSSIKLFVLFLILITGCTSGFGEREIQSTPDRSTLSSTTQIPDTITQTNSSEDSGEELANTLSASHIIVHFDPEPDNIIYYSISPEIDFSPDKTHVVLTRAPNVYLWKIGAEDPEPILVQTKKDIPDFVKSYGGVDFFYIRGAVFSSDGELIKIFHEFPPGSVIVLDPTTGKTIDETDFLISDYEFTSKVQQFLELERSDFWNTGTSNNLVDLFNKLIGVTEVKGESWERLVSFDLAISPDQNLMATATDYGQVTIWDLNNITNFRIITDGDPANTRNEGVAFFPDGTRLIANTLDGVQIFDITTGEISGIIKGVHGLGLLTVSPDNRFIAGTADSCIKLFMEKELGIWEEFASSDEECQLGDENTTGDIDFSPDGKYLSATFRNGRVEIWDVSSLQR